MMLTGKTQEFLKAMNAALSEMTESEITDADLNRSFAELGVDSLMALELVVLLEREFRLSLTDLEIKTLRSPADVVAIAQAKGIL